MPDPVSSTFMYKYTIIRSTLCINIYRNCSKLEYFRATGHSAANTRVLSTLRICLIANSLRIVTLRIGRPRVAKWPFSGCERAHFRGRNGRYRVLIRAILRCDMGSFVFSGRRKRLLRMIKRCGVIAVFMR